MANWRAIPDTIARRFLNQRHNPWTKDAPISREQALLEAALLQILDDQTYSERDLADRWHRSRRFVRAALEDARNEMEIAGVPGMGDPKSTGKSAGKSAGSSEQKQEDTDTKDTKTGPERDQKDTKKHDRARGLSVEETIQDDTHPPQSPPRLPGSTDAGGGIGDRGREPGRSAPGTREEPSWRPPPHDDKDAPPDAGGKPAPAPAQPRPPSPNWSSATRVQGQAGNRAPADDAAQEKLQAVSARLTEVWHEEAAKMPKELRGRSPGWTPPWDLDLLEAGAEDAEDAIRALAELCRGTAARSPRVFEWSVLMGLGSRRLAGCWREALAWKRGVGGEPDIGRTWRGGTGDGKGQGLSRPMRQEQALQQHWASKSSESKVTVAVTADDETGRKVKAYMQGRMDRQLYEVWIGALGIAMPVNGRLVVEVPSEYHQTWVMEQYGPIFLDAVSDIVDGEATVEVAIAGGNAGLMISET